MIWKIVLGGNIIRPTWRDGDTRRCAAHMYHTVDASLGSRPPTHRFSLLQTCRQIYSEAAILPWHLSTFRFYDESDIYNWLFQAPASQAKLIRFVQHGTCSLGLLRLACGHNFSRLMGKLQNMQRYDVKCCLDHDATASRRDRDNLERLKLRIEAANKVQFTYEWLPSSMAWDNIFVDGSKSHQKK